MIEGLLRHCTDMKLQNYVDTHGQSEIAFAFCRLLGLSYYPELSGFTSKNFPSLDKDTYSNYNRF